MLDLIDECGQDLAACGYQTVDLKRFDATCCKLFVDSLAKAKSLGFDRGHYFVLNAPKLPLLMEEHTDFLRAEIGYRLSFLMKENKIKKKDRVLFVGIGNPAVPADAFGVKTVEKISIMPFKKKNRIFKIMPNVFLNTGLNAYDVIHLIVEAFDIDTVVLVDSLATKNIARLGTSIQFNDAGLTPGSALNNFGMPINKGTLKVPCICVGVPFMISAKEIGAKRDVFLTDKDVESQVEFLSSLVAEVLDGLM